MKILQVIPNLGIGGAEKILLELCRRLDSNDYNIRVVSLKSGGETAKELEKIGIPVTVMNSPDGFLPGSLYLPALIIKLRMVMKEYSPNIIQTWLTRANVAGRIAAKSAGVGPVVSSLRVMEVEKGYHILAERWTQAWAKVVTVNCTALKKFAVEKIRIPAEKIVLIPNGIEAGKILHHPPLKMGGNADTFSIGTLGRLHRQKGMDIFLRAAKIVLSEYPQTRFLIGGDGPERENLKSLSENLKIQGRVSFLGEVLNPSEFFAGLDIFVLASRWEGMPNVILETMAQALPIVSTSVGGVEDLIEDRKDGLLATPENAEVLAQKMMALIESADLRERVSRSAYAKVKEKFSMEKMVSAYKEMYEKLSVPSNRLPKNPSS